MKKKKNNILKIIGIAVILVVVIIFAVTIIGKQGGSTVGEIGENLKIKGATEIFNIKTVSQLEKITISDSIINDGEYVKIKVKVENLANEDLSLVLDHFELVDKNKNKIYETSAFLTSPEINENSILLKTILIGTSEEGYLYFYEKYDDDYTTDYSKMNNVKYLKISVISKAEINGDGAIKGEYKDYYLKIA